MPVYSRVLLSGSTNGRPIGLGTGITTGTGTATSITTIHTAVSGTVAYDEVYLWAQNITGGALTATFYFGGTTTADLLTQSLSIPANSAPIPIITGQVLNGGTVVYGYASALTGINVEGYINRIQ